MKKSPKKKTGSTTEFFAQYKDPRWQKKRLEILERDKFTCLNCLSADKELHVHHLKYQKNTPVWSVDDCFLVTLCTECHDHIHKLKTDWEGYLTEAYQSILFLDVGEEREVLSDAFKAVRKAVKYISYGCNQDSLSFITRAIELSTKHIPELSE